ncbi:MAG: thiopurine S-methyltransferase [Proteobacteria bacterium]|nr:thiopurine S-methyltransferase [Pseudomonadota bacterium]
MKAEYWLQRWQEGRIGWHHDTVMPLLEKHWPALGVPRDTRVLVPLCGKSLDMLWLARQGMQVLGVEISPIAVESFLAENHLLARVGTTATATRYEITNPPGGGIEIINGDLYKVDQAGIAACRAFYDRGALIAQPAAQRERMAREVYARLPAGSRGLLIVLDYPQHEKKGPPFSVDADEVHRLFDPHWDIEQLERRDILASQPSFSEEGVTALHTAVYRLTRRRA